MSPFVAVAGSFARLCSLSLLVLLALTALPSHDLQAQSRKTRDLDAVKMRMAAAEGRYRDALVKVGNNDPAGTLESNAALEDMEDAIAACLKLKGCPIADLLATYKRLLKTDVDGRAAGDSAIGEDVQGLIDTEIATVDVPASAEAAALLSADGQRFVNMVRMNPAVQAGIRRWLTDMRVSLIQSHENYQYLRDQMSPSFQRSGLPEALLFGIMANESTGRVHIGSRAGAVGLLQFMPATGRRFGLGPDGTGFDTRYDPRMSAAAAAAYLNERYAEFGNNIELWLAAYNGGEGRALRRYQAAGGQGFWSPGVYETLPAETKDYVPMVIAAAWLFLHPKKYGLEFPRVDTTPDTFQLARGSSVNELAICLGNGGTRDGWFRVLRNLNPRYEAGQYIPAGTMLRAPRKVVQLYRNRCVSGPRAEMAAQLAHASRDRFAASLPGAGGGTIATGVPTPVQTARTHAVRPGENLVAIARAYSCDLKELAQANRLQSPAYVVRTGLVLKLEGCGR